MPMKVAIVYDRVNKWGGAERTLLMLHKMFPDAPLYTSVYDKKNAPWAEVFDVRTSFLQHIPFFKHNEIIPFLMPLAFESFRFDEYDLVISVSSEAAKGIITKPGTKHICLCLTPTRYLWSGYEEYFSNKFFRWITLPLVWYMRWWDTVAAYRPDVLVANSQEVQSRIKMYYKREAKLLYPPTDAPCLTKHTMEKSSKKEEYFLVVSRLSSSLISRLSGFTFYKRVDLAIHAATKTGVKLKVAGKGNVSYFKRIAGPNVEFLGFVSDDQLHDLYAKARAFVFPGKEDFGMVMVEAGLHGTPVIAYRGGGALEIVEEGINGEFFDTQSVEALSMSLVNFDKSRYNEVACIRLAARFSSGIFEKQLKKIIASL